MGREVRRVPKNWEHPKNDEGHFIPLHEGCDLKQEYLDWWDNWELWQSGKHPDPDPPDWRK